MIPERISIEGFLCYRDRQVVDLSGLSLCMLSGPNGSGKSSVFDAMTFALFGTHRAGGKQTDDLVNKRCNAAAVEFDFTCGGTRWRARRTITIRAGAARTTRDIRRITEGGNDEVVPDTTSDRGFANWIDQHVGMSADAFTTSMLLRQGQADRLLTATPAERANLLKTVVGLQHYADLERRSNDLRKEADGRTKALGAQVAGCPSVSVNQIADAEAGASAANTAVGAADAVVDRLQSVVGRSRNWTELQTRLARTTADRRDVDRLLAKSTQITTDLDRLTLLRKVVPLLTTIWNGKCRLLASVQNCDQSSGSLLKTKADLSQAAAEKQNVQTAVDRVVQRILKRGVASAEVDIRLAELNGLLKNADAVAERQRELARLTTELAALPADPAGEADRAWHTVNYLKELSAAVPWLKLLIDHRSALVAGRDRLTAVIDAAAALPPRIAAVTAELESARILVTQADDRSQFAHHEAARAAAELKLAQSRLADARRADGQTDCPTCGRPLSDQHKTDEMARRVAQVSHAAGERAAAAKRLETSIGELQRLQLSTADTDRALKALSARHGEEVAVVSRITSALQDDADRCNEALTNLNKPLRTQVAPDCNGEPPGINDWAMSVRPTTRELQQLVTEVASIKAAEKHLGECRTTYAVWQTTSARIDTLKQTLTTPDTLPIDVDAFRTEHARLAHDRDALGRDHSVDEAESTKWTGQLRDLDGRLDRLSKSVSKIEAELSLESHRQGDYRDAIAAARNQLPPEWANHDGASAAALSAEIDVLAQSGVEQAATRLQTARAKAGELDEHLSQLQNDLEAIPPEARRPVAEVQAELSIARASRESRLVERQRLQSDLDELIRCRARRLKLDDELNQSARTHRQLNRLTDLLGRGGLQLHLMRQAEKQIVTIANAVLARLTGGDLLLQLRSAGDGSDSALDLQAIHRRTSTDALNVAFLSGSQQFRVAVALALAVGQYAGGGHRIGECVIIEEGFGSLDRQGQAVMIEELHRLTDLMKRVILVSHQESFADAFPHGYKFSLEAGATKVSRLT
jgi:exonuclease SbcC